MKRIAVRIKAKIPDAQIAKSKTENTVVKLIVRSQGVQIKVEVTPVLRGCVFESALVQVKPAVEDAFWGRFVSIGRRMPQELRSKGLRRQAGFNRLGVRLVRRRH